LVVTDRPEDQMLALFADDAEKRDRFAEANEFATGMFQALDSMGKKDRFHHMLLV
jgi:hypothetical protein